MYRNALCDLPCGALEAFKAGQRQRGCSCLSSLQRERGTAPGLDAHSYSQYINKAHSEVILKALRIILVMSTKLAAECSPDWAVK